MLQILYGPDRTANSAQILSQICEKAKAGIAGQILIVPEQYSHETERALCARGGDTISRYAEVLSFTRLAARVFSVCGGVCEEYLDENGRILTLYLAAQRVREQLKFYAAVMTKPDFLKQLGALMEELLTSCVQPDALHAAARQLNGRLAQKVTELALLYESYLSVCKTGRADPVTRQMRLCELLDETDYLDGREVYLDGFSDFTVLQMQLLAAILAHAENVHVSCLTSGGRQAACQTGNETIRRLRKLAAEQRITPLMTRAAGSAHRAPEVQVWLDGLFFGGNAASAAPEHVELVRAGSVQAACAWAARAVRAGAAEGLRYRDFTICVMDEAAYALPMQMLLVRAGIPVYHAGAAPALQKPLAAALLAAFRAALRYEQEDMFTYLKSDLSPIGEADCDRLEQYAQYWNIRGTQWQRPWQMHPRGLGLPMTPEDEVLLRDLNALREEAAAPVEQLRQQLRAAKSVRDQVLAAAGFLEQTDFDGCAQRQQEALEAEGQKQRAQECGQLSEMILQTLEQMDRVLGGGTLETELFVQLFSMLLANGTIGTIPSVCDAVQLTTLPMLRHRRSRVLIVLGADDGLLPAFSDPGGLLANPERQKLCSLGVELSAGRETAVDREMSWVCAALSAAEQRVCLVTAAEQASFLYERTKTVFPAIREQTAEQFPFFPDCAAAAAAALRQPVLPSKLPEPLKQAADVLAEQRTYTHAQMQPEAVRALYGPVLQLSASKIDCFAGCRYAYFLQYGLRAKPWKQAEFDAPLFGSFVHDVLEHTVREAQARGGFGAMTDAEILQLANTCMDACMKTYLPQGDARASREAYLSVRNRQETTAVVMDVARELRLSQFQPAAEELKFAKDGAFPPISYSGKTGSAQLVGQIDRVDVYETDKTAYFRIVDYKTGHKDFEYTELLYGRNLQMLLYLFALQSAQKAAGKPMQPAGALYVPGRCDMVKLDPGEAPEEAELERRKQLRRKGLVLNDEKILHAMEAYDKQPEYLPVQVRQEALTGDLISLEQLKQLEQFVTGQVAAMIDEIYAGKTAPNPIDRGPADSACRYCDYASACHKDVCGAAPRRFAAVSAEEFWVEVERRLQHG